MEQNMDDRPSGSSTMTLEQRRAFAIDVERALEPHVTELSTVVTKVQEVLEQAEDKLKKMQGVMGDMERTTQYIKVLKLDEQERISKAQRNGKGNE
ncbi:MAG: hypothetical protein M1837_006887 [Sclerophora amabilis]|nr:MAG: hypothetical protein M1837_006887 [Sclerophora amabilis]